MANNLTLHTVVVCFGILLLSTSCSTSPREQLEKKNVEYTSQRFHEAVKSRDTETVRLFLESGMDVNTKGDMETTALMIAAKNNDLATMSVLRAHDAFLHAKDAYAKTPILYAAEAGSIEALRFLIKQGVYVDEPDVVLGLTPLMYAAFGGQYETVLYLVEEGADVQKVNKDGGTVLINAAFGGNLKIVQFLVEQGADIHAEVVNGTNALHYAVERGNLDIVQYLHKQGLSLTKPTHEGLTPLEIARRAEQDEIARYIELNS